jgi:hypothetical protein
MSFYNIFSSNANKNGQRKYIQLCNCALDSVYIDASSGVAHWTLPTDDNVKSIIAYTHIDSNGAFFYETLPEGDITPNIPSIASAVARKNVSIIERMNRSQCEEFIGKKYSQAESSAQKKLLADYIFELNDAANRESDSSGNVVDNEASASEDSQIDDEDPNHEADLSDSFQFKVSLDIADMNFKLIFRLESYLN